MRWKKTHTLNPERVRMHFSRFFHSNILFNFQSAHTISAQFVFFVVDVVHGFFFSSFFSLFCFGLHFCLFFLKFILSFFTQAPVNLCVEVGSTQVPFASILLAISCVFISFFQPCKILSVHDQQTVLMIFFTEVFHHYAPVCKKWSIVHVHL